MNLDALEQLTLSLAPRAIIRWNKKGVTHIISDSFVFNDTSNMDYTKEASYDLRIDGMRTTIYSMGIDNVTKVSEKCAVTLNGTKIPALEEKLVFEDGYSAGVMNPLMLNDDIGDVLPILYHYSGEGYDAVFANKQYVQIRLDNTRTITVKRKFVENLQINVDSTRNVSVHKTYSISGKRMDEILTVDEGIILRRSAPPMVNQTCEDIWPENMIDLFTDMAIIQSTTMNVNQFKIKGNTFYVMINRRWYKAVI